MDPVYEVGAVHLLGHAPDTETYFACGHAHESVSEAVACLHERYHGSHVVAVLGRGERRILTAAEQAEEREAIEKLEEQQQVSRLLKEQERLRRLAGKEQIPKLVARSH
jgi:hypothetical protein